MTNKQPCSSSREEAEDRKEDPVPFFTPVRWSIPVFFIQKDKIDKKTKTLTHVSAHGLMQTDK